MSLLTTSLPPKKGLLGPVPCSSARAGKNRNPQRSQFASFPQSHK